ncbi:mannitol dehydrogenase family protein [Mixta tenebrionis]|uniref:Mannitol dehydrogenase family protein n=1 Tax=Mixta tenebrionis TaxID=2562439 RepID=A0A506VAJ2_9GAMM|nr:MULTISPECIES: mannitol dehydrogenase family protein [Mixta]QHM74953.1 Polyol:NADP oxidoreductase [Mixta theicola]TPW42747.1 mannitol dehydrogenase family protein [Mixta tenebrionis]
MLSVETLANDVKLPDYDRARLRPRILHIGFGAFHRAHQAVCADRLAREQQSDWGYIECEINLQSTSDLIGALRKQDHLYSVTEMADSGKTSRVIGALCAAIDARTDGIDAVIEAMSQPEIAIVSMTVTEKGYCHHPATGELNLEHPFIQHDLAHPDAPQSLPGVILAAIRRRRDRGLPPFSVMSCDNMPENGHVTRNVVVQLAQAQDAALADYIRQHLTFPSTMVDRIVPAMTQEALDALGEKLGCYDPVAVQCEPFFQWVIEDNFVNGRPAWEKAGAELVQDVLPFEEMKLRMLNGSHSFLAYLGYLAGYQHISDCMADEHFLRAAHTLMLAEQAPTLRTQNVDLNAYADSLIARYKNRAIKHRTWQIASDGTQKLPQRWLDSIRWHLAHQSRFDLLALGVAGWIRYVSGVDEQGAAIEINDPLKETLAQLVSESNDGEARITALLSLQKVFGEDLPANTQFTARVLHFYQQLQQYGAKETVKQVITSY